MPRRSQIALVLLLGSVASFAHRANAEDDTAVDRLLVAMNRRLAVMHDVARWKWANGVAISDPAREAKILDGVAVRGKARGLDPKTVREVFAAQMEASKLVQQADFDRWKAGVEKPPANGPDLAVSRARIDRLDGELLEALARVGTIPLDDRRRGRWEQRADEILVGPGIDASVRARAIRPLR